jgi:hypothetical protein
MQVGSSFGRDGGEREKRQGEKRQEEGRWNEWHKWDPRNKQDSLACGSVILEVGEQEVASLAWPDIVFGLVI